MTIPSTQPVIPSQTAAGRVHPLPPDAPKAAVAMLLVGLAIVLGGVLSGAYNDRAWRDQTVYHLRVIEQFSRELPRPDLSNYYSATGPLYHLLLAPVHRWITPDERALRVVSGLFTVALLALLGWAVGRHSRWRTAVALCLPMACSLYVFVSAVWLLPDNLAWLTCLVALLLAYRPRADGWTFVVAGITLALAVSVRQINLWPLGVLVAGVALTPSADRRDDDSLAPPLAPGWPRGAGLMLLTGVPAVLILAWLYRLWHGLTPPAFQTVEGEVPAGHSGWQHEGPNLAVPAMVLSVLAATGLFFAPLVLPTIRDVVTKRGRALALIGLGVLAGAATALAVPTDFTPAPGPRYSGLWNVAAHFPVVAHRSLLIAALAAAGGATVVLWFLALGARDRWIWLSAWACFAAAQSANAKAWHKYYEPFCLMMLALAAAKVIERRPPPRWAIAGPVLLAALLAGVTLSNLTRPPGG